MAIVVTKTVRARIDNALERAECAWGEMPELAAEWAEWDEPSRTLFEVEWPIQEDLLGQLEGWAAAGAMSPAQATRYAALLQLVTRYQPVLATLLSRPT